mgnify:FL=1
MEDRKVVCWDCHGDIEGDGHRVPVTKTGRSVTYVCDACHAKRREA